VAAATSQNAVEIRESKAGERDRGRQTIPTHPEDRNASARVATDPAQAGEFIGHRNAAGIQHVEAEVLTFDSCSSDDVLLAALRIADLGAPSIITGPSTTKLFAENVSALTDVPGRTTDTMRRTNIRLLPRR
jgi:hypothetical protein